MSSVERGTAFTHRSAYRRYQWSGAQRTSGGPKSKPSHPICSCLIERKTPNQCRQLSISVHCDACHWHRGSLLRAVSTEFQTFKPAARKPFSSNAGFDHGLPANLDLRSLPEFVNGGWIPLARSELCSYVIWRNPWMIVSRRYIHRISFESTGFGSLLPATDEKYPQINLEDF